jgi:hypothetical protein
MGNLVSSDAVYKKSDLYTKQEVDDIIKNLNTSYTKQEVDSKINSLNTAYTKQEVDSKFASAYTKQEVDSKFATAYTKQEVDSKITGLNIDTRFGDLKKEFVWCADGQLCKVPDLSKGLSIGNYSIVKNDTKLCLKFGEKQYCFDGNTVSQL